MSALIDPRAYKILMAAARQPLSFTGDKRTLEDARVRINATRSTMRKMQHQDTDLAYRVKVCRPVKLLPENDNSNDYILRLEPRTVDPLDTLAAQINVTANQEAETATTFTDVFIEAAREINLNTNPSDPTNTIEDFFNQP